LNLSTYKANDEVEEEEKANDDEVSSGQGVYTPPDHQLTNEEENPEGDDEVKKGIDSILNPNIQTHTFVNVPVSVDAETPYSDTTNP
nr:hypothetical protein [Tanacetum cinerariifolium]